MNHSPYFTCKNQLLIEGDRQQLRSFIGRYTNVFQELDFYRLVHPPVFESKPGKDHDDLHAWKLNNWGVLYAPSFIRMQESTSSDSGIECHFDTPSAAPIKLFRTLGKRERYLTITLSFALMIPEAGPVHKTPMGTFTSHAHGKQELTMNELARGRWDLTDYQDILTDHQDLLA